MLAAAAGRSCRERGGEAAPFSSSVCAEQNLSCNTSPPHPVLIVPYMSP